MMAVLTWMVFGVIVGALARWAMPGPDPAGIVTTMLLGVAGAVVAGAIGRALGMYRSGDAAGLVMSVLGAVLLLFLYRRVTAARM